jgi:FkbM family methyltransferase
MCVLNVGANIGLYTLIAGKCVGDEGVVYSFEPSSLSFVRLAKNVRLNKLLNVRLSHLGISDFKGRIAIMRDSLYPDLDSHFSVKRVSNNAIPPEALEIIACNTLDNYFYNISHKGIVDMMIIDVEGSELSVLKGAQAIIKNSSKLIILVECTKNIKEINTFLTSNGFFFFEILNENGELKKIHTIQKGNIVAIKY